MKLSFIICITLLQCLVCKAEDIQVKTFHYHVMVNAEKKGTLQAAISQTSEGNFDIKLLTTLSIFPLQIISEIKTSYRSGKMISAETKKTINGIRTEHTNIQVHSGKLMVSGSEIEEWEIAQPVIFSVGLLYHFEPKAQAKILSERLGANVDIHSIGLRSYELRQPDGVRNYFFYRNGVCFEMHTRMRGKEVKFILQN
jgi:hypothetical protein